MSRFIDLTGQRFGRLVAVKRSFSDEYVGSNARWLCRCDCGTETVIVGNLLRNGTTKSCGCYRSDYWRERMTKHGKCNSRLAHIWYNMRQRCNNPSNPSYTRYGGRGISVCKEWDESFDCFYDWAVNNGYDSALTLDRINNNGNYEPENCRFADAKTQAGNRRPSSEWNFKNFKDWKHKKYKYPKRETKGR